MEDLSSSRLSRFGDHRRYPVLVKRMMIRDALSQMMKSNDRTQCDLEGGAYCASFEIPPTGEPWIQAKIGVINIHFPFERPPNVIFAENELEISSSMAFPAWESRKFATVTFDNLTADDYAAFVDKLFRKLFGLPPDYTVNTDIFDIR